MGRVCHSTFRRSNQNRASTLSDREQKTARLQRFIRGILGGHDYQVQTGFIYHILSHNSALQDKVVTDLSERAKGGELFAYRVLEQMVIEAVAKRKDNAKIPMPLSNFADAMLTGSIAKPTGRKARCPDLSFRFALMVEYAQGIFDCRESRAIGEVVQAFEGILPDSSQSPSIRVVEEAVKANRKNKLGLFNPV